MDGALVVKVLGARLHYKPWPFVIAVPALSAAEGQLPPYFVWLNDAQAPNLLEYVEDRTRVADLSKKDLGVFWPQKLNNWGHGYGTVSQSNGNATTDKDVALRELFPGAKDPAFIPPWQKLDIPSTHASCGRAMKTMPKLSLAKTANLNLTKPLEQATADELRLRMLDLAATQAPSVRHSRAGVDTTKKGLHKIIADLDGEITMKEHEISDLTRIVFKRRVADEQNATTLE
ncbi:MAG: hypothetical protein Q9181_008234 [Wetmoreana brouardii]